MSIKEGRSKGKGHEGEETEVKAKCDVKEVKKGAKAKAKLDDEGTKRTNEVMPLNNLLHTSKRAREQHTTHGVSTEVSTVGVHLSSPVVRLDVDGALVHEADGLDVVGRLDPLQAGEGASGDEAGAMPGLGAPGDHLAFGVGDDGVGFGGAPNAEVYGRVKLS